MTTRSVTIACLSGIFLDAAAFGVLVPVLPPLMKELGALSLAGASQEAGITFLAFAGMQLLFSPFLARLSDRLGRKPVLVGAFLSLAIDHLIMATTDSYTVFLLGRAIAGGLGGVYPVAVASMIDVEVGDEPTRVFGRASAAIGAGFVLGPALGGVVGELSPRHPLFGMALLFLILAGTVILLLPETLRRKGRRHISLTDLVPLANLRVVSGRRQCQAILLSVFLVFASSHAYFTTWPFFTAKVDGWSSGTTGLSMVIYGALLVIIAGVCAPALSRKLGDARLAAGSLAIAVASFACLAFARSSTELYGFLFLGGFSAATVPALQSLLSRRFSPEVQGELQGAVSSMQSLAAIAGPLLMTQVFAAYAFPGTVFIVGTIGLLGALILVLRSDRLRTASGTAPLS